MEARGILYSASPVNYVGPMKIINNFFNSDLVFHLQRTDDHTLSSVSARHYALIRTDLWSHALKWFVIFQHSTCLAYSTSFFFCLNHVNKSAMVDFLLVIWFHFLINFFIL